MVPNDPLLAPWSVWEQRVVEDRCSGEQVTLPDWTPPPEYHLRRCPDHEARQFPAWVQQAPEECLLYWQRGFLKWPGPIGEQPRKWVEAMWHLDQLMRREGFSTDPMELFLRSMTQKE